MDRFIVCRLFFLQSVLFYLKSNMDRFIVNAEIIGESAVVDLKSNMDRFIVVGQGYARNRTTGFKIQYG